MNTPSTMHPGEPEPLLGWSLGLRALTPARVIAHIEQGLSMSALDRLRRHLGLSDEEVSQVVGASVRTLARRRKAGRLGRDESDRLYRLARLYERAVAVFGGDALAREEARQWFHLPQWGLGGATPLAYARTEAGAREVGALLDRIDYGVLA